MAIATAQAVQLLNLAYFGRPGDPASLPAWGAAGITESKIAEIFVATSEYATSTAGVTSSGGVRSYTTSTYINTLYNRVVGRDAASSEVTAWSDAISAGLVTHDNLGHVLVTAILNLDESVEMRKVMMAKLDSANLYSDYLDANPTDLSAYSTQAGIDSGRAFMSTVTTTTAKTYAEVAAVADLLDNPTKYTITSANVSGAEGDDITFTVTLDSAPAEAVTVNYVTGNGSTDSSDFTAASGSITFAAGQTSQVVTVKTTEDTSYEESETFTITFSGTRLNASVQAVGTITNDDANPNTAANTFTLTTGSNTFTGLDGDDVFDASTSNSLNTFDTLTGGGGTDTVNSTLSNANVVVNSTGVENFNFTATTAGSVVNMENADGVSSITNINSVTDASATSKTLTIENIQSAITAIKLSNDTANSSTDTTTTLDYDASALSGSSDDVAVTLDDIVDSTLVFTRDSSTTNTLETVSLHSISEANTLNDLQTTGVGTTKLEVTGDQALTITADLDTGIATVDGSAATGALTFTVGKTDGSTVTTGSGADDVTTKGGADNITTGGGNDTISSVGGNDTIDAGAGNDSITGGDGVDNITAGAGDDVIVLANDDLTTDDTIAGGSGSDTISFSGDEVLSDTQFTNVTGITTLTAAADVQLTGSIGAEAAEAGITQINFTADASSDADNITIAAAFTNNLTVDLDGNGVVDNTSTSEVATDNKVDATAYTGSLTVTAEDTDLDDNSRNDGTSNGGTAAEVTTLIGGTGSDTLKITANSGSITSTSISGVTKFETFEFVANGTATSSITLSDNNAVKDTTNDETLTVDGSAMTAVFTVDASAENDAKIVIKGGSAADVITASTSANAGDTITGGAGDDIIAFSQAALTSADSIDGGTGANTIRFDADELTNTSTSVAGIVDADFTGVSNIQTLTAAADKDIDYSLGALAAAAGVTNVNFTGTAGSDTDTLTVLAGFDKDLTVDFDVDTNEGNSVVATAYTKSLTVTAAASDLDTTTSTITGGTGTDTLLITADGSSAATPDLSGVSKVEKITVANDVAVNITLADGNVDGSSETITVDTTAMATAVATIDASAENDGNVVINSGAAADVITLTTTASTGPGDSVSSGAGNDQIKFATGNLTSKDTIDGGAGTDSLIVKSDATIADEDFTNVTNIETLDGNSTTIGFASLTLGAEAKGAGIATINLSDTGAAEVVTLGAGFTKDVTIVLDNDATSGTNKIDASGYASGNTVTITAGVADLSNGSSVHTTITGGAGSEVLEITSSSGAASLDQDDFDTIVAVDTIKMLGDVATTFTLANESATYTHNSLYDSYTVDASSLGAAATINATEEADGKLSIIGSAYGDTITVSQSGNFGDSISAGAGADTIKIGANAYFTAIDSIDGGAGDDILHFVADATLTDALFANVSSIKTLEAGSGIDFSSVTLGANALAAGVDTISFTNGDGASVLTLGSGYTGTIDVTLTDTGSLNDKVDASGTAGAILARHTAGFLNSADTITGGTGTTDKLIITASEDSSSVVETADISNVSAVETIVIASGSSSNLDAALSMGANDTQIAAGKTLTIDATDLAASGETFTFTGTESETDGFLSITSGAKADSIIGAGAADTIDGGNGADTIDGGSGADSLTGGSGGDTFVYASVAKSTTTAADTISDFATGSDKLDVTLDYSGITGATVVNATLATAAAGITAVQSTLSAERGQTIYDTTNNALYINVNNDNLITSLDYKINSSTTNSSGVAFAEGDINYTITTAGSADTITAGGGADSITAGAGTDSIVAGAGNDTIVSGTGNDTITGGTGTNTFVFNASGGTDTITDFTTGTANILDIFGTGLAISAVAKKTGDTDFTAWADDAVAADGAVVMLSSATGLTASQAAGKFATSASDTSGAEKMGLLAGDYAVFIVADDNASSGTAYAADIFTIFNNSGTVAATQIGELTGAIAASFVYGNIV